MKKKVYLCGVDLQHELGEALGGVTIYPSEKDLKSNKSCWKSCGIVELEINTTNCKWIEEQDLFNKENTISGKEINSPEFKKIQIEHFKNLIEKYKSLIERLEQRLKALKNE